MSDAALGAKFLGLATPVLGGDAAARLLDDAWRLTDAMIEAEAEWLPAWLGGTAADRGGVTDR